MTSLLPVLGLRSLFSCGRASRPELFDLSTREALTELRNASRAAAKKTFDGVGLYGNVYGSVFRIILKKNKNTKR